MGWEEEWEMRNCDRDTVGPWESSSLDADEEQEMEGEWPRRKSKTGILFKWSSLIGG